MFLCRDINGLKTQTNKISVRCPTLMISTDVIDGNQEVSQ